LFCVTGSSILKATGGIARCEFPRFLVRPFKSAYQRGPRSGLNQGNKLKMKNTIRAGASSAAVILALFAGTAVADEPAVAKAAVADEPAAVDVPANVSDSEGGFRAYIDPKTGKLRQATGEERAAEARAAAAERKARPKRVPKVIKNADGSRYAVDVDGYFAEDVIATIGPDGKVIISYESEGQPTTQAAPAVSSEEK
jgi:hypothetical protein